MVLFKQHLVLLPLATTYSYFVVNCATLLCMEPIHATVPPFPMRIHLIVIENHLNYFGSYLFVTLYI